MRIITHACSDCGTVVAGNVLEDRRVMKCPRIDCEAVHRFTDLDETDRDHITANRDKYTL